MFDVPRRSLRVGSQGLALPGVDAANLAILANPANLANLANPTNLANLALTETPSFGFPARSNVA